MDQELFEKLISIPYTPRRRTIHVSDMKDANEKKQNSRTDGKKIATPIGIFDTRKEACQHLGICLSHLYILLKTKPDEYYRIDPDGK